MNHSKSWGINLDWVTYSNQDFSDLKEKINPIDRKFLIGDETIIKKTTLPFYQDKVKLIWLTDINWKKGLEIYYLIFESNLYRLNGTSPPIHEINAKVPLKLNKENVEDYLKFFCYFVQGDHGAFLITDSLQPNEIPEIKKKKEKEEFSFNMHPTKFNGMDKDSFLFASIIWYDDVLFGARFKVDPTGMVHMLEDEPILKISIKYPYILH